MYGKLKIEPNFLGRRLHGITDLEGNNLEMFPSLVEWLSTREGHKLNVFVSNKHYFITDEEAT
jgi:hypothetical protein